MPVENILRAYIDETVDEEVIEETIEKIPTQEELRKLEEEKIKEENANKISKTEETVKVEKPELEKQTANNSTTQENKELVKQKPDTNQEKEENIKLKIDTDTLLKPEKETVITNNLKTENKTKENKLTFNDNDHVLDMGTNKENIIEAPKTIERLEEISKVQNEKRKAEEAEEDEDEEDKLKILDDTTLQLETLDVHDLNKKLQLETPPLLDNVEILS